MNGDGCEPEKNPSKIRQVDEPPYRQISEKESDPRITNKNPCASSLVRSELHAVIVSTNYPLIFHSIVQNFRLLHNIGIRLGVCLSGAEDPLHLLFGAKTNRDLLADEYTNAPVFSTRTQPLSTFLSRFLMPTHHVGPVRILEIGGGVGGTTGSIIKLLEEIEWPFMYTFSDISTSLVAAARNKFTGHRHVKFIILDVESLPELWPFESQDIIISTNTIQATKSLVQSCAHICQMLARNGMIVCLLELGRQLAWYDLVFGLLDGWWRFDDGRAHALAEVQFWDRSLREAGFKNVRWTDSDHEENDLI
ncbi:MAG: hypothetical protein Q9166_000714 [cf. Caloplaca sp. 2 TL-2023]